ncbi:MAG: carbohydrate ABC transporter permease [Acetivibrionales bacterium]
MFGATSLRRKLEAILLSLPAFALYTFILIYPIINLFYMSFHSWNGIPNSPKEFIGIRNYILFFNDARFMVALKNIGVFMLSGFVLILPVAFFLATVVQSNMRAKRFLKSSYFMPQVISRTAIALMWYFLLYPSGGPVAVLFKALGLESIDVNFLGSKTMAIYAITVINAWAYAGFNMLIFSAGLTQIPVEIYEAARVDGANSWQRNIYITLPMLNESLQMFTINCIVGSITTFEMVYVTTGGGPGSASEVFGTLLYKNAFTYNNFGYSNAIGVFLLVSSVIATILLNKLFLKADQT